MCKNEQLKDYYFEKIVETVSVYTDVKFDKYETGIRNNLFDYLTNVYSDRFIKRGDAWVITKVNIDALIDEYFSKREYDFSILDCVERSLRRIGVPPKEEMHLSTLEEKARELYRDKRYIDNVYLRRVQGNRFTPCVSSDICYRIINDPAYSSLILKQTEKAIKKPKNKDSVDYQRFEHERKWIEYRDELAENEYEYETISCLTQSEKTDEMIKAIYGALFSEFDFNSLETDKDEASRLGSDKDFGKRYQDLCDTLDKRDYGGKYYQIREDSPLIAVIANKVTENLIKYFEDKEGR